MIMVHYIALSTFYVTILQNLSESYIRQNHIIPPVDSYTITLLVLTLSTTNKLLYLRLILKDVFSGWCVELEWRFLAL